MVEFVDYEFKIKVRHYYNEERRCIGRNGEDREPLTEKEILWDVKDVLKTAEGGDWWDITNVTRMPIKGSRVNG